MRKLIRVATACALVFLWTQAALPQETTGTITGFVKDSSGAVVPGVEVIVRNIGTGLERRSLSGTQGEYTVTLLPIGRYVEFTPPAVQSESAGVGAVITGRQVTEMPLNGWSIYQLVALQPGVSAATSLVTGRVGVGLDNLASVNVNGTRAA